MIVNPDLVVSLDLELSMRCNTPTLPVKWPSALAPLLTPCFALFTGVCRNLKSIVVQIGIEDYFEDPNSPEARKLFDEMVNKLQVWNHLHK